MVGHSKPDSTGRSSGRLPARLRKLFRPPRGEPFIWLTRELLEGAAWRSMGANTARLMNFLLIEHMNHAGTENGNLKATYDQLDEFGLTRGTISDAVDEAFFLGLIRLERGGRWAGTNQPSIYRLTFYADKYGAPATNEWKGKTPEAIDAWKADRTADRKRQEAAKKQDSQTKTSTTVVPFPALPNGKSGKAENENR